MPSPTQLLPRRARTAVAVVAAGLTVAACAAGATARIDDAVPAAAQLPVSAAQPSAEPTQDAAPDLETALRAAEGWTGTATYALRARTGTEATVTVVRSADRVRVDVAGGGLTSTLMSADAGWVACAATDRTTCVLAAAPGAELPAAWDPGVGRLLTSVLPGLAARTGGLYASGYLVAGAAGPAAACVEVVAPDTGRYCVTEQGLLRRAKFAGGTLTLTSSDAAVDPARFAPPVTPTPLA